MSDDANKYELTLPSQRAINSTVPRTSTFAAALRRPDTGGILSSTVARWRANSEARALKALANRSYAEAEYFDALVQLIDSYIRAASAADTLQELPEILALDRAKRRADRAEEYLESSHGRVLAKHRRAVELAHAQHEALNAEHAFRSQRALYELDAELNAEFSFNEPEATPRYSASMTDDAMPEEEHVLMAAKILRKRRTAAVGTPAARLRYR